MPLGYAQAVSGLFGRAEWSVWLSCGVFYVAFSHVSILSWGRIRMSLQMRRSIEQVMNDATVT